jgi:hypothetical protein
MCVDGSRLPASGKGPSMQREQEVVWRRPSSTLDLRFAFAHQRTTKAQLTRMSPSDILLVCRFINERRSAREIYPLHNVDDNTRPSLATVETMGEATSSPRPAFREARPVYWPEDRDRTPRAADSRTRLRDMRPLCGHR